MIESAAAHNPRAALGALLAVALALAGCATRQSGERDGPATATPPGLAQRPDAQPRVETPRAGGPNKPYEVLGRRYEPLLGDPPLRESGLASWYGRKFHGRPTSNGEIYDMFAMTAAHKTMPLPSYARVRNPANGREVVVRVNDRGPFADGRVIDLSYTAALKLGLLAGVAPVELRRITNEEIRAGLVPAALVPAAQAPAAPSPAAPPPAALPTVALAADDPAPSDAALVEAGARGLWLQLAALRNRDGAVQLQQRLLREWPGQGVAVLEEGGWFRVQVGPFAQRAQALAAAERARMELGLNGQLVRR